MVARIKVRLLEPIVTKTRWCVIAVYFIEQNTSNFRAASATGYTTARAVKQLIPRQRCYLYNFH
jgi:hypothetical protein